MTALAASLALAFALLQIGAMPALVLNAVAAPLPIALLAAWGTARHPAEVWPALLLVAATLGFASEQRVGWYLLALLPTAALLLAPTGRTATARLARAALAALAASVGAWSYLALLLVAAGAADMIAPLGVELAVAALWAGVLGALLTLVLWPLRARSRGLFA